jgi:hypothetical protein
MTYHLSLCVNLGRSKNPELDGGMASIYTFFSYPVLRNQVIFNPSARGFSTGLHIQ